MAFQPINFLNAPLVRDEWGKALSEGLQGGLKLGQAPQQYEQMLQENQKQKFANALTNMYGKQEKEAEIGAKQAETAQRNALAESGGFAPSGLLGHVRHLDIYKQKLGENHPTVKMMQKAVDAEIANLEGKTAYYGWSTSTNAGKHLRAEDTAKMNLELVMQNPNSTPKDIKDAQRKYQTARIALEGVVEEPFAQKQADAVTNLHTALDAANVDKLKFLVGPKGAFNRKLEEGKPFFGKEQSQEYADSLAAAQALEDAGAQYATVIDTPAAQMLRNEITSLVNTIRDPWQAAKMTPKTFEYTQKRIRELMEAQAKTAKNRTIQGASENAQNETEAELEILSKTKKYSNVGGQSPVSQSPYKAGGGGHWNKELRRFE